MNGKKLYYNKKLDTYYVLIIMKAGALLIIAKLAKKTILTFVPNVLILNMKLINIVELVLKKQKLSQI